LVRAIYSGGSFTRHDGDRWFFAAPNETHADKCEHHRAQVEQVLAAAVGSPVRTETTRPTTTSTSTTSPTPHPSRC
jgi:hypothetical protein